MTTAKNTTIAPKTTKEAIQEILSKLAITDDANWTDAGEPALDIVRALASDDTITRQQINEAQPGFIRSVGEPKADGVDGVKMEGVKGPSIPAAPTVNEDGKFSIDEMRAILDRRVNDAEAAVLAAKQAQADATMEVSHCEARLVRAHRDRDRQYPPVTPSQAIKAHLASQVRQSQLRAGIDPDAGMRAAQSPIDEVMSRNTRRGTGQSRPTRPVMDGRVVTAA